VIVLAGQPQARRLLSENKMKERQVRFVAFRVPFEEATSPVVFIEIEDEALYNGLYLFKISKTPLRDKGKRRKEGFTFWRNALKRRTKGRCRFTLRGQRRIFKTLSSVSKSRKNLQEVLQQSWRG